MTTLPRFLLLRACSPLSASLSPFLLASSSLSPSLVLARSREAARTKARAGFFSPIVSLRQLLRDFGCEKLVLPSLNLVACVGLRGIRSCCRNHGHLEPCRMLLIQILVLVSLRLVVVALLLLGVRCSPSALWALLLLASSPSVYSLLLSSFFLSPLPSLLLVVQKSAQQPQNSEYYSVSPLP